MNTLPYTILRLEWPTLDGSGTQYDVSVGAKAKYNKTNPLEAAHELIALRLGVVIGLPIPNGVPISHDDDGEKKFWASLSVCPEQLPKATDADIATIISNELLACGVVVFDSWILNQDRFRRNISQYDGKTYIFDHGRAFGAGHLERLEKNVGIIGIKGEESHCLSGIKTLRPFDEWHKRILSVPDRYLVESVSLAADLGMSANHIERLTAYLLDRRRNLRDIFRDGRKDYFPHLDEGLFDPLADDAAEYVI